MYDLWLHNVNNAKIYAKEQGNQKYVSLPLWLNPKRRHVDLLIFLEAVLKWLESNVG